MPTAIKSEYCPQPQPHAAKDPRDAQTLKANHAFSGLWLVLGSPPKKATRQTGEFGENTHSTKIDTVDDRKPALP